MFFHRITSEGLAHHSYYLADDGAAVVVDPRRDVDVYLDLARDRGERIVCALETHRNEDYAIGSTALAELAGADVLHSGALPFRYGRAVGDGDFFDVGRLRIAVLETPGHTFESLSFAAIDTDDGDQPFAVFTGDTLFVGDTGRVDLLGEDRAAELATRLYDSIEDKLLPLGDGVLMFPAHGAGSVCGGGISERELSSLGLERLLNPSLAGTRAERIAAKRAERHLSPPYFRRMETWNLDGNAPVFARVPSPPPMSPGALAERARDGAVVIDTRRPQAFAGGHIPGSYNLWLDGIPAYLGWIVDVDTPIVFVLPEQASIEHVTRLAMRIGFDEIVGYLRGGFDAWQNDGREVERHATTDTADLRRALGQRAKPPVVLDVRTPAEREHGTIAGSVPIFVGELEARIDEVPRDRPIVTMCSVGKRGGIAASILARHGIRGVANYLGGYAAWSATR